MKNEFIIKREDIEFPSPYGVSFILMLEHIKIIGKLGESFRLLTEYHSFLSQKPILSVLVSTRFRLLTEYHSFLFRASEGCNLRIINGFPSPYGVSFILIH